MNLSDTGKTCVCAWLCMCMCVCACASFLPQKPDVCDLSQIMNSADKPGEIKDIIHNAFTGYPAVVKLKHLFFP